MSETIDLKTARDELRVRLHLALPPLALRVEPASDPAGVPSVEFPALDLYDRVEHDAEYSADAIVSWVLEFFDSALAAQTSVVREVSVLEAMDHQRSLDQEALETSNAAGIVQTSADVVVYLRAVSQIVKRGMGLSEQWDLARTIEAQAENLTKTISALVAQYPSLAPLLKMPEQGLVLPGDAG